MTRVSKPQREPLTEPLSQYIQRIELCDESRPSCLNCLTTELPCDYRIASPSSQLVATPVYERQITSNESPAGVSYSAPGSPILDRNSITTPDGAFSYQSPHQSEMNMLHLELLHHMPSVTCKEFRQDGVKARQSFDVGIKFALGAPFLMHELLAISALHLSTLRPIQKEFYSNQAAELQSRALTLFNSLPDSYNSENPIPVFLFSSFLGIHVLFDTLLFRTEDFSLFMDRFVGYLRLHRGVNIIARGSWTLLQESELRILLSTGEHDKKVGAEGNECAELKKLMQTADLSQASVYACQQSIERLQWVFDSSHLQTEITEDAGEADLIFAWPITISPEFTELLLQKRPEALAILAHFAVLLHWRRALWIINDGGMYLIKAIVRYLGSYWKHWLALPLSVLEETESKF